MGAAAVLESKGVSRSWVEVLLAPTRRTRQRVPTWGLTSNDTISGTRRPIRHLHSTPAHISSTCTFNTCTYILNMHIQHLHIHPQHAHSTPAHTSSTCTFNTCTYILNMHIQHLHIHPQHVHSTPAHTSSTCTFNTCTYILNMYACRIPTGTGAQRARRSSRPRPAGSLPGGLCQGPVGSAQWRTVELPVRGQRNCPVVAFAAVPPRPLAEDLVHPSPCMHRQEENQAPVRPHRDLTQLRLRLRIGRRHRGRPPRTNGRPAAAATASGHARSRSVISRIRVS